MKVDLNVAYYYVVNMDLCMSRGKIAAQVSHVAMKLGKKYGVIGRAIILRGTGTTLKTMLLHSKSNVVGILDAGLTEVPSGSLTCIGFRKGKNYQSELAATLKLL